MIFHKSSIGSLDWRVPDALRAMESTGKLKRFEQLGEQMGKYTKQRLDLERKWAKTQRLIRVSENVVLAANLGSLSGAEIIQALKEDENTRHVRAILLEGDESDRIAALEAGASAHVKAADLTGLRDTLEALMGVRH